MRKSYNKVLSLTVVLAMLFTTCMPIRAEDYVDPVTQAVVDHLEYMLPQFAGSENIPLGTVTLGSPLSVYRTTSTGLETIDHRIHPIFSDQSIVALANVIGTSSETVETTLYIDFANALQQYIAANPNIPFAIVYAKEGIYALSESNSLTLLKEGLSVNPYSIEDVSAEGFNVTRSVATTVCQLEIGPVPRVHLDVDPVGNTSLSCCGGICWAACVAMIKNYYDTTNYEAVDIHDMYGCVGAANPRPDWYIITLDDLGMIDYTLSYDDLTYPILYNFISNDQLLFTRLDGKWYNKETDEIEKVGHIVVGYGYQYNTATAYFQFMDPNTGHNSKAFPATTGPVTFQLGDYSYVVDYYIAVEW